MAHYKKPTKVSSTGREVRLRRDRKRPKSKMTKDYSFYDLSNPNPHPDGGKPTEMWVKFYYPAERRSRRRNAEEKRAGRRRAMRRDRRDALKDQEE